MKNFFKDLFAKKYPERARKDDKAMKRVYAGPPQDQTLFNTVYDAPLDSNPEFKKLNIELPENNDEVRRPNIMEAMMVYAGPEQMSSNVKLAGGMFVLDNNNTFAGMSMEGNNPVEGTGQEDKDKPATDGSEPGGTEKMV